MNYFPISHHFPTPPSSLFDDHIGGESCIDLKNFDDAAFSPPISEIFSSDRRIKEATLEKQCSFVDRRQLYMKKNNKDEYPPLIPLLARTGNLPSHMPWILKRHYTSDGRLILSEERVKHHEYFLAHRENGRLTLQLIPLDDEVSDPPLPLADQSEEEEDTKLGMDDILLEQDSDIGNGINKDLDIEEMIGDIHRNIGNDSYDDSDVDNDGAKCGKDGMIEEEVTAKLSTMPMPMSPGNGGSPVAGVGKCSNFNSMVRVNGSGLFGMQMQVPTLRPVHS